MNKKALRTAGWALGLSMVVAGIGTVVGTSQRNAVEADASDTSIDLSKASYKSASASAVVWETTPVTMTLNKGTASAGANNYLGGTGSYVHTRFYAGQYVSFAVSTGYEVTAVTFTATGASHANFTSKTNCTTAKSDATNTVTPTDGTKLFEVNCSGNRITSVAITFGTATTKYNVTFAVNGGSAEVDPVKVEEGDTFEFPSAGTKAGYTFAGWSSDGGTTKYQVGDTSPAVTKDIEYTAYWAEDPVATVIVTKGTFTTEYVEGEEWDWEHLVVSYTTEGGAGGTAEGLTAEDFTFTPSAPTEGLKSVSVTATFGGVTSAALVIDGLDVGPMPKRATYAIGGSNTDPTVSPSGLVPAGSTASWNTTFTGQNLGQETANNSQTLTISGFEKETIITGITLYMHSNASAGAGTLSYVADDADPVYLVGSANSGAGFNTWGDNTSFGTSFRDVVIGDALGIEVSKTFELTITATTNSLYCTGFAIDYAYAPARIAADKAVVTLPADGTSVGEVKLSAFNFDGDVTFTAVSADESVLPNGNLLVEDGSLLIAAGTVESAGVKVTVTGTDGVSSPSLEITVVLTPANRNVTGLEITTKPVASFKQGSVFSVEGLVASATFDAGDSPVEYSANAGNLSDLAFDIDSNPIIPGTTVLNEAGIFTVTVSLAVGENTRSDTYLLNVEASVYFNKATSLAQLWDGQKVLIADCNATKIAGAYADGTNIPGIPATFDTANDRIDVDEIGDGVQYTIGRVCVDGTTYYTFSDGEGYLYAAGEADTKQNYLKRKAELDSSCYWTIELNEDVFSVVSVENEHVPYMQYNNNFACYHSASFTAIDFYVADSDLTGVSAATYFNDTYMHMDADVNGQCNTYYPIAKGVWNAMLDDDKLQFADLFEDSYLRLENWAAAHGDKLDLNLDLVQKANSSFLGSVSERKSVALLASVIGIAAFATGGLILVSRKHKRKED